MILWRIRRLYIKPVNQMTSLVADSDEKVIGAAEFEDLSDIFAQFRKSQER